VTIRNVLIASGPLPCVSVSAIRRVVGGGAFQRGHAYQSSGRVTELTWDPDAQQLHARVRGSAHNPYECEIDLIDHARDGLAVAASWCSCPVGSDCKHVAATLLQCRAALAEFEPADAGHGNTGQTGATHASTAGPRPVPGWKRTLAQVTPATAPRAPSTRTGRAAAPDEQTVVALQFRVDGVPKATGPSARAWTPTPGPNALSVSVRPVKRGTRGAWVGGQDVSWDALRRDSSWLCAPMDSAVRGWFRELRTLMSDDHFVAYLSSAWLPLGSCSRFVWPHLRDAERFGIPLVGPTVKSAVRLAGAARLALDAAADPDGGLRLAPHVEFDGVPAGAPWRGAVGASGLFTWDDADAEHVLTLAPTAAPLTQDQISLLWLPTLAVPAGDVPEFLADYYPSLCRRVAVTNRDGSIRLPEPARPVLVATAQFESPTLARLAWEWEYRTGEVSRRLPFVATDQDGSRRDTTAEAATVRRVEDRVRALPGFEALRLAARHEFAGLAALDAAQMLLPALADLADVRVTSGEVPGYVPLDQPPLVTVAATDTDEVDWFDLGITVTVDGRAIPFTPLFQALATGGDRLLLDDGAWLRVDRPVFDELRALIEEAQRLSDRTDRLRISRYQASLWRDLEDLADQIEQSDAWRRSAGALVQFLRATDGALPQAASLPRDLTAELRPYQQRGFEWLALCWQHGLGGILADDMGLGKTVQALTLVAHSREQGCATPFLVVAPASVVGNWATEAARFTPGLRVATLTETTARRGVALADVAAGADVVVTSYMIFRLEFDAFRAVDWAGLLLDEAQFVKNRATRANECARLLPAPFKLAITGTPMENNLMELWAMLAIVAPGLYPSAHRFAADVARPIEASSRVEADDDARRTGAALLTRLRRRVRPVLLRRTKDEVAPDLPERQEQVQRIELAPRHRRVYDTHLQRERSRVLGLLTDFESNRIAIFRSLTLLRRLALDAGLVDPAYRSVPSSKLDALAAQLAEITAEGHRALVFSQFTGYLSLVAERCRAEGIGFEYLDGKTTGRPAVIRRFTQGTAPLFLISLKAGGFGLNLTAADYVYLLDPWWNPATERQAIDRAHRIGQTRRVLVNRLVAAGTIEEKVLALAERKGRLFDAVLGDEEQAFSHALGADDIRVLLEDG